MLLTKPFSKETKQLTTDHGPQTTLSNELNPDVVSKAAIPSARQRRTAGDYLALAISTCGVGYFPIAPGTMGSLVGVGLYLSIWAGADRILSANALAKRLTALYV